MTPEAFDRKALLERNLFLKDLPAASSRSLFEALRLEELPLGRIVARSGDPVPIVIFPVTAGISTVNAMSDGSTIEVMLVGREGFYGTQIVLGDPVSGYDTVVQIAGKALTIDPPAFLEIVAADDEIRRRVLIYVQTLILSMSQFLGCNRLHELEQRCARWLLMCHDRVPGDEILITHEFIAEMLGAQRPRVTLALQSMENLGAVERHRGTITIVDRAQLMQKTCECYARINDSTQRLMGFSAQKTASIV